MACTYSSRLQLLLLYSGVGMARPHVECFVSVKCFARVSWAKKREFVQLLS